MSNIYSLTNPWFWLLGLVTVVAWWVTFYLPGSFFISQRKLNSAGLHLLLSHVLGLVLWGGQGVIFGYLQLRWLSYVYVAIFVWLAWQRRNLEVTWWHKLRVEIKKVPWWWWLVLGLGTATQVLPVIGSGLRFADGVHFYRVNAYDGVLHLAFMQSIINSFPPAQPGASDLLITNYHYWSDLVMAELARVWQLPITHLFFQFFPTYISLLTGLATYYLIKVWGGQRSTGLWGLFFLYLGSDIAYLFMLILHQQFGEHISAIDNGVTQFLNVPHTFAKLILTTGLIPLTLWIKTKKWQWGVISMVLFATLVGFKVYYGMFAALGFSLVVAYLGLTELVLIFKSKPTLRKVLFNQQLLTNVGLITSFALIAALIFFPVNKQAGGLFYSPLEWPKLFLGRDNLNFMNWWQRQQVYEAAGNTRNVMIMNALAILICLGSVFGTRLLGFYPSRTLIKNWGWSLIIFLLPGTLVFLWLGLYTLQTSGLFNVFNFFVVATIPLSLSAAFVADEWWRTKLILGKFLVGVVVLLTLPRSFYFIYFYANTYTSQVVERNISNGHLAALQFIKDRSQLNDIVQTHPYHSMDRITPHVAFFTDRPTHLTGVSMLESHNQPIKERKEQLFKLFSTSQNESELARGLREREIKYLYLTSAPEERLSFPIGGNDLKIVFENKEARVIEVSN